MNHSKTIFMQISVILITTFLVSAVIAFLYNQFWLSDTIYLILTQIFAMFLFIALGFLLGSLIQKRVFLYAMIIAIIYLIISMVLSFSMLSLVQALKASCFCFGTLIAKSKRSQKNPLDTL